jgi:hypothetical protein
MDERRDPNDITLSLAMAVLVGATLSATVAITLRIAG